MTTVETGQALSSMTMSVTAAAELLGISRSAAYAEALRYRNSGGLAGLPNIKFAGRVLVSVNLLNGFLMETGLVPPSEVHIAALTWRPESSRTRTIMRRPPGLRRASEGTRRPPSWTPGSKDRAD